GGGGGGGGGGGVGGGEGGGPDGGVSSVPAEALPRPELAGGVDAGTPPASPTPDRSVNEQDRIVEFRVEGNRRVEPQAIERVLKNKVGQIFNPELTSEDLPALWGLRYLSDIP